MQAASPPIDPAAQAAALLRRLGFATLVLVVPAVALVARRATVVLVPIGVVLLLIAALLDGANPRFPDKLRRAFTSRTGLAALVLIGWAALSIVWTPFSGTAGEKIVNIAGAVLIAMVGVASLPERMRSSNLYLVPVGVGATALVAVWLGATDYYDTDTGGGADAEGGSLERGLVVLVVVVWPALAWLQSRARLASAVVVAVLAVAAVAAGLMRAPAAALAAGALVYGIALVRPPVGRNLVAIAIVGALALAPLFPLVVRPFLKALGPLNPVATALRTWGNVITADPLKLITGHGLDTSLRARFTGMLPVQAPQTLPFELWYELGIVGAWAAAAALYFAIGAVGRAHASLAPGVLATFAAAFTLTCLGAASAQVWWLTTLGVVVLTFVAIERGQFRTSRPKATFFRPKIL